MTDQLRDDYLWDRTGTADPEVARLEELMATLRGTAAAPLLPRRRTPRRRGMLALAAAAVVCLAVGGSIWLWLRAPSGWWVQALSGTPAVEGVGVATTARLRTGQWLTTDGVAAARLAVGRIGQVVVAPNSRVQLLESRGRERRISLERGTIHARIWAPPKFFFVNTPSAVAIDLGCAYTLSVDDKGRGLLRVTQGWVALEHDGRESFIPEGAMCLTSPGTGPGTPRYDDAPAGYGPALTTLDFENAAVAARAEALDLILSTARRRDALTLWHLLSRGSREERSRVFDQLVLLAPPPTGISREAVLAGDRAALTRWWDSLGLGNASWWKFLKKKL